MGGDTLNTTCVNWKAGKSKSESKFVCKTNAWLDFVFIRSKFLLYLHTDISLHCLIYNYFFSSVFRKNDSCILKIRCISHMKKKGEGKDWITVMKQDPTVTATGPETAFPVFLEKRGIKSRTPSTSTFTYPLQRPSKLKVDRKANTIWFKMQFHKMDIFLKYLFRNIEEDKRNSRWCHNIVFNHISEKLKMNYKKLA